MRCVQGYGKITIFHKRRENDFVPTVLAGCAMNVALPVFKANYNIIFLLQRVNCGYVIFIKNLFAGRIHMQHYNFCGKHVSNMKKLSNFCYTRFGQKSKLL